MIHACVSTILSGWAAYDAFQRLGITPSNAWERIITGDVFALLSSLPFGGMFYFDI